MNTRRPGAPHVPTDELRHRIDKLDELGVLVYDILGGEPVMHPDLPALVAYTKSKQNGANLVTVISNGFLLTADIIDALNEAGLTQRRFRQARCAIHEIAQEFASEIKDTGRTCPFYGQGADGANAGNR